MTRFYAYLYNMYNSKIASRRCQQSSQTVCLISKLKCNKRLNHALVKKSPRILFNKVFPNNITTMKINTSNSNEVYAIC